MFVRPALFVVIVTVLSACSDNNDDNLISAQSDNLNDDFSYPDGPVPAPWINALGSPVISNNMVCGDTQSAIMNYTTELTGSDIAISYAFTAEDASGFESYVIFNDDDDLSNSRLTAGIDGGANRLSIDDGTKTQSDNVLTLSTNTTYKIIAQLNNGSATVTLLDENDVQIDQLAVLSSFTALYAGFITGRTDDGLLTCVDDFFVTQQ